MNEPVRVGTYPSSSANQSKHNSKQYRIYSVDGGATTLCGNGGGMGAKTGLYAVPKYCNDKNMEHLMRPYGSKAKIVSEDTDKSPTLLAAMGTGGGNGIYNAEKQQANKPVYAVKDGMITIKGKQYPIKLADGHYVIRKLTVTECKRLQTVPEWYEFPVSDSQAYKMLGNGWTVDVIQHLIKHTVGGKVIKPKEKIEQMTLEGE